MRFLSTLGMTQGGQNRTISFPRIILACVVIAVFSLMFWASFGESAIMDELAHIPAGYGYVHNLDYRLNPEHPPLVKALAALPLLLINPTFPTDNSAWTTDVNGQWDIGTSFLYESNNDANLILRVARIAPILLTLILIVLMYIWSAELLGIWWGLLPAILFGLSPTVLAHGHYVTTDMGATLGIFLAAYLFIKFLLSPSIRRLLIVGIAFGLAQLMKFSAVLLIPYFIILILFYFAYTVTRDWRETDTGAGLKRFSIRAWEYIKSLIIIFAVGYIVVVYPVYFLFTFNQPIQKQAADTESILTSFANGPTPAGQLCKPARCLADLDIWLSKNYVTRPFSEYMLGVLMVIQRASGGNTSYFLGEVSNTGSAAYFPMVYLLKETLPTLIIIFFGLLLALIAIAKKFASGFSHGVKYFFTDYLGNNFAEFSMFAFVILYWAYSMRSPLNIGVRHLLPTIPFIYVLAASAWKKWLYASLTYETNSIFEKMKLFFKSRAKFLARLIILFVLVIWFIGETISGAPYFLSYFNEFGGGTYGGYRYVTDSNYDWGQDLLRLKVFVDERNNDNSPDNDILKIAVDYFGGGDPKYYLGGKEVDWSSSKGNPADKGIHWLAVSVNTLQSAIQPLALGQNRNPGDGYEWLVKLRLYGQKLGEVPAPDYRVGTSIFVYKL
ncbi:MAG: glycosyltransferase family 39 protein [Candidatus Liptonbacteria bacterium]|nr:glycosyltransferase family 39 protein [Candidatus Liptonbacteria bacterium]